MIRFKLLTLALILLSGSIFASEVISLRKDGDYRFISNVHLVNELNYKSNDYHALIEVPAGTTAKWEVNHKTGHLEWEFKKNKPRNVKFLPYPGNYGFIPQSILDKKDGGDGDPLDVIVLGAAVERGSIQKIRILGALKLLDKGEEDDKLIAIVKEGPFKKIDSIEEMMIKFPGVIEIIRTWFEGYKGSKIQFMGYMKSKEAKALIEKAHKSWKKHNDK